MIRVLAGDCRDVLPTLEAEAFDCVLTSPPYWGLRDYGVGGQIGLEPTLDLYLETMAGVCREIRRVLKPGGTFWLNVGDCYAGSWGAQSREHAGKHAPNVSAMSANQVKAAQIRTGTGSASRTGLKPKDLCMVPNRLALLLQADGWWVRSEIIWAKPNPMPESVTDRPTSAHEKVWLLTKSERYFYDAEAIAEPLERPEEADRLTPAKFGGANKFTEAKKQSRLYSGNEYRGTPTGTRNSRNVWQIASQPYKGTHFATMPPTLAERCILAGCPMGGHVLDPFGGVGTTALVADRLGRNATLIDLKPDYCRQALDRCRADAPLLVEALAV
jgi:DNA modification methylase